MARLDNDEIEAKLAQLIEAEAEGVVAESPELLAQQGIAWRLRIEAAGSGEASRDWQAARASLTHEAFLYEVVRLECEARAQRRQARPSCPYTASERSK